MFILPLFILLFAFVHTPEASSVTIVTPLGQVQGSYDSTVNLNLFLGIPFVEPPVRFRPAQPKQPWNGVLDATSYKPECIQRTPVQPPMPPNFICDENCLFLDVYAPPNATNLPVMVFIYGGGFTSGGGSLYNGSILAQHQVIVVIINYRVGALGFLQLEEIKSENPNFPSLGGLNGIFDQIRALEWVKGNIASFGGNPGSVTIFGESAGSISVCLLLAMSRASGLFSRAIMESGVCLGPWTLGDSQHGIVNSQNFMKSVNASSLSSLRALPASTILESTAWGLKPTIDNYLLTSPLLPIFLSGNLPGLPSGAIIVGTNSLDSPQGYPWYPHPIPQTPDAYMAALHTYFGTDDSLVAGVYPPVNAPDVAYLRINAHVCATCPSKILADNMRQKWNVFLYEFSWNPKHPGLAGHAAELSEVFGYNFFIWPFLSDLSVQMINYWTTFAATGVPMSVGNSWPRYLPTGNSFLDFNDKVTEKMGYHEEECGFWAKYGNNAENQQKIINFCYQSVPQK